MPSVAEHADRQCLAGQDLHAPRHALRLSRPMADRPAGPSSLVVVDKNCEWQENVFVDKVKLAKSIAVEGPGSRCSLRAAGAVKPGRQPV
jgi:hypothetical protein